MNPHMFIISIAAFYIVDLFFVHVDIACHHICFIAMVAASSYIGNNIANLRLYVRVLLAMEIPSIFFNLRRMMDIVELHATDGYIYKIHKRTKTASIIRTIKGVLFIATFFKFRIVDMYQLLIANPVMYTDINRITLYNYPTAYFLYTSIFCLFALNVYWACLIVKKVYADFADAGYIVDSARSCEFLTQYSYAACAFLAAYAYQYSLISKHLYSWQRICLLFMDVAGIIFAALASYRFHKICYEGILVEGFNDFNMASTMKRRNAFASEIGAMKIRSILCVCAKMLAAPVNRISVLSKIIFIGLSVTGNIVTYIFAMKEWFTPNGFRRYEIFVVFYSEKDQYTIQRKRYISILNGVGITIDTILIALFVNHVGLLAFHYTLFLIVGLMSIIQPFGKMNHFWLHCAFAIQILTCCRLNIESALYK